MTSAIMRATSFFIVIPPFSGCVYQKCGFRILEQMKAPAQLISLTRWQATKCPFSTSSNGGMDWAQASVA